MFPTTRLLTLCLAAVAPFQVAASVAAPLENRSVETRDVAGDKAVFMHIIMGNTFGLTSDRWDSDFDKIKAAGIDAVALNIGIANDWQIDQVGLAYDAAARKGISAFISFDYSSFPCDVGTTLNHLNRYKDRSSQFRVDNKPLVSSFLGACLGSGGWRNIQSSANAYLMPFIEVDATTLQPNAEWGFLQNWFCFGCAWPQTNAPKTLDDDNWYLSNLGDGRFSTSVSPWLYTHYSGGDASIRNRYLRGDDHLLVSRWEQLISIRSRLRFVEFNTWNDYGESHYVGPVSSGNQPSATTWVNGFPHTAWLDLSKYYIEQFKTGTAPQVTRESIYYWLRPHPKGISASADSVGRPNNADWALDKMYAVVFCQTGRTCSARLQVGGTVQNYNNLQSGPNKIALDLNGGSFGSVNVQVIRDGQTVINQTPGDFTYRGDTAQYNFNAYVGSASA